MKLLNKKRFIGVDVGSATTKVVIIEEDSKIISASVIDSGTDLKKSSETCLKDAVKKADISKDALSYIISTGYGRKNVEYSNETKTEISCHGKGAFYYFPKKTTIIDIGGQDNKIIKLDDQGRIINFKMNRKCAAGTGAFLEEIARKLNITIDKMDAIARKATKDIRINSYCTVFASTEILEKIRAGESVEDMVKGAFNSVVNRVLEMESFTENVVVTGGVMEYNPILADILEERLGFKVLIPPRPQIIGAFGAALFAKEVKS